VQFPYLNSASAARRRRDNEQDFSTSLHHVAIVEGWERRRTVKTARTTVAYTAKLQAP
jgi:hypothetical protein